MKCHLAVGKTPVINFGKAAVLGRASGYFFLGVPCSVMLL